AHASRTIMAAGQALKAVKALVHSARTVISGDLSFSVSLAMQRVTQATDNLAELLTAGRYYGTSTAAGLEVDPRFLVFEAVFDLMLRKRQVEMVTWFQASLEQGVSRVQQMIMGAGKTTVVGPLLTLLLADGQQLVTQVMPTALLEQTRSIMRSRFGQIITKRVYTLEFERSVDDDVELVAEIFGKLDAARRRRSVVCTSPEAIKSLLLKFVEHLHALEQVEASDLTFGESARANREIGRVREALQCKSDMADAIVRVLDMWRGGVLIMDEVDQLLHPLRSELNFPIGAKDPIDMAGYRWDFPIFLIDGLFSAAEGHPLSERLNPQMSTRINFGAQAILDDLRDAVAEGYSQHALQRSPHMILLDKAFYEARLKPALAKWALLWIAERF
ncbi:nxn protein, partial [Nannochloropsis gaditana CCMP526]